MNDFDRWIMNNPWKICVIYPVSIIATGLLVMVLSMSAIEALAKEKKNEQSQQNRDDKTD